MMGLTPRQSELLAYLQGCERCPSLEEMRLALGMGAGRGDVGRLLNELEDRGHIRRPRYLGSGYQVPRSIELIEPPIIIRGQRYRFIPWRKAA